MVHIKRFVLSFLCAVGLGLALLELYKLAQSSPIGYFFVTCLIVAGGATAVLKVME